jgi:sodium/bile acid cotransporter 7
MNTILTNGLCFVILPGWVWLLHGQTSGQTDFWKTATQLLLLVVLPMSLSQVARGIHPASAKWATGNKILLSVVAQTGILMMVLIGAVQAGERLREGGSGLGLSSILVMIAVVAGLHLIAWWTGFELGHLLGFDRKDRIGAAFSGSQKTLMIGLTTALQLKLSILPLVTYHLLQLILGTLIADRLRHHSEQASAIGFETDDISPD